MPPRPSLGLAVPLYDEADVLVDVVADLRAALDRAAPAWRLALVDNGSRDGTRAGLRRLAQGDPRLVVVELDVNRGYGGGILAGLRALWPLRVEGRPLQVLGWAWGDGQVDPAVLPALLDAVAGGAALARVHRVRREDGWQRRLVSRTYAGVLGGLGVDLPDVHGCPKLFPREVLARLDLRAGDWFLDLEAVLAVRALGGAIHAEPVVMRPRAGGASKVRLATLAQFAHNLLRWRLRGDPHGARALPPGAGLPLHGDPDVRDPLAPDRPPAPAPGPGLR